MNQYIVILNRRNNDLGHLRRKSSIWEDQIYKLRLQPKADINDIPLQPTLMHNQSQDQIDLRSKFRNKVQRSRSVPNAFEAGLTSRGKIQLFDRQQKQNKYGIDRDDDDDLHTDDDFSDDDLQRASTTSRNHGRGPTLGLDAIIDEEEELNECEYHSPMSLNEFKFPFLHHLES